MSDSKITTQQIEQLRTQQQDVITAEPRPEDVDIEEELKESDPVPRAEDQLDALGIPNWRELEKQVVRRLDFTLMPCLWSLYLFNYRESKPPEVETLTIGIVDRASIAQARVDTLIPDLNLTGSDYSTAVSILSYGQASPLRSLRRKLIITATSSARSPPT